MLVTGVVQVPENPVKKCTQQVEILVQQIWNQHKSLPRLPMNLDDASNIVLNQKDEDDGEDSKKEEVKEERGKKKTIIGKGLFTIFSGSKHKIKQQNSRLESTSKPGHLQNWRRYLQILQRVLAGERIHRNPYTKAYWRNL